MNITMNPTQNVRSSSKTNYGMNTPFQIAMYNFIVINGLGAVIALVLNLLAIVTVAKTSPLWVPSNILVLGLAISDLGTGVFTAPSFCGLLVSMMITDNLKWVEYFRCFFSLASSTFVTASFGTITAITIDRFLAITLHLSYQNYVTLRRTLMVLVAIWLTTTICITIYTFKIRTGEALILAWRIVDNAVVLLFIVINISLMIRISQVVRKHSVEIRQQQEQFNITRYKKTVNTMYFIIGLFSISFIPSWIYANVDASITINSNTVGVIWAFIQTLQNICSVCNPVIYFWRIQGMRSAAKRLLRRSWTALKTCNI